MTCVLEARSCQLFFCCSIYFIKHEISIFACSNPGLLDDKLSVRCFASLLGGKEWFPHMFVELFDQEKTAYHDENHIINEIPVVANVIQTLPHYPKSTRRSSTALRVGVAVFTPSLIQSSTTRCELQMNVAILHHQILCRSWQESNLLSFVKK